MIEKKLHNEIKINTYELFIGSLSLLAIFNIFFLSLSTDQDVSNVLYVTNWILTAIFIADFLYRFIATSSKKNYFFHELGWADLLSCLPFPHAKIFRIFRVFHIARITNLQGNHGILHELLTNKGKGALLTIFFLTICVIEFGSIAILSVENNASHAKILTASDAMWWIMETITTV